MRGIFESGGGNKLWGNEIFMCYVKKDSGVIFLAGRLQGEGLGSDDFSALRWDCRLGEVIWMMGLLWAEVCLLIRIGREIASWGQGVGAEEPTAPCLTSETLSVVMLGLAWELAIPCEECRSSGTMKWYRL